MRVRKPFLRSLCSPLFLPVCFFAGGAPWFHGIPHSNDKMSFFRGRGYGVHYDGNPLRIPPVCVCRAVLYLKLFVVRAHLNIRGFLLGLRIREML